MHLADSVPYTRLNKNDSALLIVDLQVGLAAAVRDWDATFFKNAILGHAAIGRVYDLPTILTTSVETGPNGPLPKEILVSKPFSGRSNGSTLLTRRQRRCTQMRHSSDVLVK